MRGPGLCASGWLVGPLEDADVDVVCTRDIPQQCNALLTLQPMWHSLCVNTDTKTVRQRRDGRKDAHERENGRIRDIENITPQLLIFVPFCRCPLLSLPIHSTKLLTRPRLTTTNHAPSLFGSVLLLLVKFHRA